MKNKRVSRRLSRSTNSFVIGITWLGFPRTRFTAAVSHAQWNHAAGHKTRRLIALEVNKAERGARFPFPHSVL
ncbi:hypothetical protein OPV22_028118 [Ensete ventricosum]|uniref:Secreted protein n=1 Tax=Ensete ventricosum TaxID=4639 RepID=A0AAV8PZI0_ENSVE|nr:hypothetical protein OPV22_028118 [Ensete ventricosum]